VRKAWWLLSRENLPRSLPATTAYWTSELGVFGLSLSVARMPRNIVKPETIQTSWNEKKVNNDPICTACTRLAGAGEGPLRNSKHHHAVGVHTKTKYRLELSIKNHKRSGDI
jgi:hypothetical protein